MDFPTAHALLRDRHRWRGSTLGVAPDDDGDLALAQIPGHREKSENLKYLTF